MSPSFCYKNMKFRSGILCLSSLTEEAASFSSTGLFSEQLPQGNALNLTALGVRECDFETFSWEKKNQLNTQWSQAQQCRQSSASGVRVVLLLGFSFLSL